MNSLESNVVSVYKVNTNNKADGEGKITPSKQELILDRSNFIIGIPFSNDIDFQGGLTSNGNINIKLSSGASKIGTIRGELTGSEENTRAAVGATVMFCKDCALLVKPIPYSDQPEARLVEERIV